MRPIDKRQLEGRGMTSDEAERVIERAARLMAEREAQGRLSREDVKAGADEVGIDPTLVDEAIRLLAEEERAERVRKKTLFRAALASVAAVGFVLVAGVLFTHGKLNDRLAEVEKKEAQLVNVLERRRAIVPELLALAKAQTLGASARAEALEQLAQGVEGEADLPTKLERDARIARDLRDLHAQLAKSAAPGQETLLLRVADEMTGAHNRISVERKRYDEAASEYNREARSMPVAWLRPLTGMPASVPLSNDDDP